MDRKDYITLLEEFDKRIEDESRNIRRITNDDLVCKDCSYKLMDDEVFGNTSKCMKYKSKPDNVLKGEECIHYNKI